MGGLTGLIIHGIQATNVCDIRSWYFVSDALVFITAQASSMRGKDMLFSGPVHFLFQIGKEVKLSSIMHVSF